MFRNQRNTFTWLNSVVESTEFCSYRNAAHLRFLCQLSRTLHDELDENMIAWSGTEAACMKVRAGDNVTRMCIPWCSYLNCIFFLFFKVPSFIPEGNIHYFVVKDSQFDYLFLVWCLCQPHKWTRFEKLQVSCISSTAIPNVFQDLWLITVSSWFWFLE